MNAGGTGKYLPGELVYQGVSPALSISTARVADWNTANNILTVYNLTGNFVSNQPLMGVNSNATWTFNSYTVTPPISATVTVTPNPANANANSNYTYTTTITP
jgi:hypothetical protein